MSTADSSVAGTPARAARSAYSAGGGPGLRGAVRNAVNHNFDTGWRGHKPEDRGDAFERQRIHHRGGARHRGERMRGGPVTDSRHRQRVIADRQWDRSRGRHAVAVEEHFGVGGRNRQLQLGDGRLQQLVEHRDNARRQLAREHVGGIGLEQRHEIGTGLALPCRGQTTRGRACRRPPAAAVCTSGVGRASMAPIAESSAFTVFS